MGKEFDFSSHEAYEEFGIPRKLARLEDGIFESLPEVIALEWPQRFLEAIPINADLNLVADKFLYWLLIDPIDGVIKFAKTERVKKAIQKIGDLYAQKIAGVEIAPQNWQEGRADAYAAYAAAADAADAAYAAYAAAADAAARKNTRHNVRIIQAKKLVELISQAPIIKD